MTFPFMKQFKKSLEAMPNVSTDFRPPSMWYTTGNYAVNKALTGSYTKGIPQGRVTILAGPSDTGKSFLLSNIMMHAQREGAFILALDSENALDYDYLGKIGVDISEEKFFGAAVITISDTVKVVSEFITSYEKEYGKYNEAAPKVLIALDSLDMLLTDTESEHFDKGVQTGDQGQRAKQMKHFLRTTVSRIKALNIGFIGTHQVYPADVKEGEGRWKINNAIRYSASQIVLITKLKLKEGDVISGIRMYCETFKSRFAKLGTKVEVLVPYTKGMSPTSGLVEELIKDGVIEQNGAWYTHGTEKFQRKSLSTDKELLHRLLNDPRLARSDARFADDLFTPDPEEGPDEPEEAIVELQPVPA